MTVESPPGPSVGSPSTYTIPENTPGGVSHTDSVISLMEDDQNYPLLRSGESDLHRDGGGHLRPAAGTSTIARVSFNFVNVVVGAGIVGLPYVFKMSGFWTAIILMVSLCWLTDYSVRLLVSTGAQLGLCTYEDVCKAAYGRAGFLTVCYTIFIFDYGAVLSYFIILGDASSFVVLAALYKPEDCDTELCENIRRLCIGIISAVFVLPLCHQRDMSALESASFVSTATVVVIVVMVLVKLCIAIRDEETPYHMPELHLAGPGIFQSCGIIAFSFVCHDSAFLLYNTLDRKSSARWALATHVSLGISLLICVTFAIAGYMTFGQGTQQNVLNNYGTDATVVSMRVLYCVTMALTAPTGIFVCRHTLNAMMYNNEPPIQECSTRRHLAFTWGLYVSALGIALMGWSLDFVMALSGAGAGALAFILPPVMHLKLCAHSVGRIHRAALWLMVVFGAGTMVMCILQAFEHEFGWPKLPFLSNS